MVRQSQQQRWLVLPARFGVRPPQVPINLPRPPVPSYQLCPCVFSSSGLALASGQWLRYGLTLSPRAIARRGRRLGLGSASRPRASARRRRVGDSGWVTRARFSCCHSKLSAYGLSALFAFALHEVTSPFAKSPSSPKSKVNLTDLPFIPAF